jgi:hypothetical protein
MCGEFKRLRPLVQLSVLFNFIEHYAMTEHPVITTIYKGCVQQLL